MYILEGGKDLVAKVEGKQDNYKGYRRIVAPHDTKLILQIPFGGEFLYLCQYKKTGK
jgi:hypothetical protein